MQSFLSRRSPKLQRAALWGLLVLAPLMIAIILLRGPDDGWDYFGLGLYTAVFLNTAYQLSKDRGAGSTARLS